MTIFFSELWNSKLVLSQLVHQYVTLRYRRTALGFLWTLINPLFTMVITSVIFSMMMRMPIKSFAVFLFTGLIPWTLFSACLLQGGGAILENEALIKKIYIPRQTFVTAKCLSLMIDALLSFGALFVIAYAIGAPISVALAFVPVAFLFIFVFSLGVALVMSVVTVFYRDSQHVMGIALQAGYYLTPIIYPLTIVPERFRWIFEWNPMYYFVQLFRLPIYEATVPSLQLIGLTGGLALTMLVLGVVVFRKYDHTLIFRL
ncbi:ABC transporter permease [Cupriavidus sp. WGtm5]|uniref:ABC transporter permease n=1 Tax=Cupriavidus sp. WGtm5 TaxID=2919926 RepID=UPI002091A012|nr:ABC transporter permease [Cupriavidus sp. WGtm5]MCO4888773.1 ABC transporter permease [Cupriavidus sp. WGtm5]